jgi:hypothetical protein
MPTYRTVEPRTDRILKDWILKERLAFKREPSLPVSELQAILPPRCKEQLGNFKPTDNVFRKMSQGFNRVSDVWIELMRFVGVQDFSPEQAIFGTVSTFLDSENVRVKLNVSYDAPSRKNSIDVLCLNEPTHQGLIRYEGDRLTFPPSIFEAVIDRRLNVYGLYCDNLSDLLLIPGVSDPQSLLIAENNARLAEEHHRLDEQAEPNKLDRVSAEILVSAEDPWMDSPKRTTESIYKSDGSAVYEAEPGQDDVQEHNELIGLLMTDDGEASDDAIALDPFKAVEYDEAELAKLDTEIEETAQDILKMADARNRNKLIASSDDGEVSDDAIALTPYVSDAAAVGIESVDDTDEGAQVEIEDAFNGCDSESKEVDGEIENFDEDSDGTEPSFHDETAKDELAERMADVYSGDNATTLNIYDQYAAAAEDESINIYEDEDAEIEATVDGHGYEIDEVDGEIENFDEDLDSAWDYSATDEVE